MPNNNPPSANDVNGLNDAFRDVNQEVKDLFGTLNSISDEIKNQTLGYKLASKSVTTLTGIFGSLLDIQNNINKANSKDLETLQKKVLSEKKYLETSRDLLLNKSALNAKEITTLGNINSLLEDQNGIYEEIAKTLNQVVQNEKIIENKMGLLGPLAQGFANGLNKVGFSVLSAKLGIDSALEATKKMVIANDGNVSNLQTSVYLAKQLGSNLSKSLGPGVLLAFTVEKLFTLLKAIVQIAFDFSERTANIAKSFGVTTAEAQILNERFSDITRQSGYLLFNQKNLLEATIAVNEAYGTSAMLTEKTLKGQIDLTKRLGLTNEEATKFTEFSLTTGRSQEDIVNSIAKQNKGILSNKKIFQEVAKVSGQLYAQYKANPDEIAKAVIQTQKLGLTMNQAKQASESLLNFETSIGSEMEAELLTGKQLNLENARYLALQGKSAEAAAELMSNVGSLNDFMNLNVIQQNALAKSIGMTSDELVNAYRTQQAINKLGTEDKKAYDEAIKAAINKGDIDKANALEKQRNQGKEFELAKVQLSTQEEFNTAVEKVKGIFASIIEGPLGKMLDGTVKMIDKIDKIPGIGKAFEAVAGGIGILAGGTLLTALVSSLINPRGTFMNPMVVTMSGGLPGMGGGGGGLGGVTAGGGILGNMGRLGAAVEGGGIGGGLTALGRISSQALRASTKGVKSLGWIGALAGGGLDLYKHGFTGEGLGRAALSTIGGIGGGALGSIVAPGAGTFAGGVAGSMLGDYLGDLAFGKEQPKAEDFISRPGQPIQRFRADDIIIGGTNPLGSSDTGGNGGNMSTALINEVREMKAILTQILNKESGVYIDGNRAGRSMVLATSRLG